LITPGDAFLVAVDDATIYASQTPPTGDALISAPKSGGAPTVLVSTANAMNLAVDDRYLYWVQWNDNGSNSSVMRVPKAGGAASVVVSGLTAPSNIAVDASHVYFTVGALPGATQAVMRVPKAGGAAEALYTGSATGALVVDARSVYWSAENALMRLDK
jgi:sugar lactone lactonase YvrE